MSTDYRSVDTVNATRLYIDWKAIHWTACINGMSDYLQIQPDVEGLQVDQYKEDGNKKHNNNNLGRIQFSLDYNFQDGVVCNCVVICTIPQYFYCF